MSEQEVSLIGSIVDMPQEEFEKAIVEQEVNVGTISNLILSLESTYNELKVRKEKIIELVISKVIDSNDPTLKTTIQGIYAELSKLEWKIVYLKSRRKDLLNLDK